MQAKTYEFLHGRRVIMWSNKPFKVKNGSYVAMAMRPPVRKAPPNTLPLFEFGFQPDKVDVKGMDAIDRANALHWRSADEVSKLPGFEAWKNSVQWVKR